MLRRLPKAANENVLVDFATSDDAGVYRLSPECALIQTVDFLTPIVDDPYCFGAIAAANALSDVYAMGGRPVTALSIVAYPGKGDPGVLGQILEGGAAKMAEAGCAVVGGHSISDEGVKFGYAVTGVAHPDRIWRNSGAQPGDSLWFTKRIGTGIISTALKRGMAELSYVADCVDSMLTLNRQAAEALEGLCVHGCTDITGFGMLGHAREMALGSEATIEIEAHRVPLLPGALAYARAGAKPGGLENNREFASGDVAFGEAIANELEMLLYDPQTSGGLLVALPEGDGRAFEKRFPRAVRVGRVVERGEKAVQVI